ncbi:hypothetical protein CIFRMM043B_17560 [Citrobacter freundii]|nr:Uncharacterised protein [Citrobacter freundii]
MRVAYQAYNRVMNRRPDKTHGVAIMQINQAFNGFISSRRSI